MDVVALVCARGGSKGLPGKNIRPLGGKPLLAWAVEQALAVSRVRRVIVSTDDDEIAAVALAAGAEVPFRRPAELAGDRSPEWLVWRHALEFLAQQEGRWPDALLVVPVTAPLRTVADIDACLDVFNAAATDVVITASPAHRNPWFNMVKRLPDGTVALVNQPEGSVARRQDAPIVYDMTTVAYVASPDFVMKANGLFEGRVHMVEIPVERSIDIDTLTDFRIAECLLDLRGSPG